MNQTLSLLPIERNILLALSSAAQPPQLQQIAERLGFSTCFGQLKLSYYVDNLEKNGFMRYNRAWQKSHVYDENALGWNLTPKGQDYIAEAGIAA
jgi:hypothetical protein